MMRFATGLEDTCAEAETLRSSAAPSPAGLSGAGEEAGGGRQELSEEALEALPEDNMAAIAGFLPPGMMHPDPAGAPALPPPPPPGASPEESWAQDCMRRPSSTALLLHSAVRNGAVGDQN